MSELATLVNTRQWLLFAFGLLIAALGIWSDSPSHRKDMARREN
jgi:hypothetical protein